MAVPVPDAETRPRRRDAARNHRLVVEAARDVVSSFGTDASMELIASSAGVGVGTVYRHFPNKEALLDELARLVLDDLVDAAEQSLALGDGSGLEAFLRALGISFGKHNGCADKLMSHAKAEYTARLRGLIAELLAQAQQHGRIHPGIALSDVMATIWAIRAVVDTAGAIAPDAWQRLLDIHLVGFRSPTAPSTRPAVSTDDLARISSHRPVQAPARP